MEHYIRREVAEVGMTTAVDHRMVPGVVEDSMEFVHHPFPYLAFPYLAFPFPYPYSFRGVVDG